eukprot:Blabericola_migrator_1__5675@NODE_2883_length_2246_cov_41_376778_g1808_i0_p1_GENE_NODE_2883_length_2246_cov_41_376778_g1808_i0NODE_2883_length_2246_cov_41_376778_g1808_i0_p1_ORF_typecomplete_len194_score25_82WBP1/PF11669_8/1_2e04WBP1/PF11669_8/0_23_NODE_2883_length_2246_cov_41_376778_g1808_i011451726
MRSVEGKPSKNSACQLDLLTVLVCPITFPTPSALLRALNATQEQVTESASGLAGQIVESASEWAEAGLEFFNSTNSSTAEVITDTSEHFTTQRVRWDIADHVSPFAAGAFVVCAIIFRLGFEAYCIRKAILRSEARLQSTEPDNIPLQGNAMPTSQSDLEAPPPSYEAPPAYDSSWLNTANSSNGPQTPVGPS